MKKIVLLRHGQSQWNLENRFTGWVDIDLSEEGYKQAINAGIKIKDASIEFDIAYTSVLKRAIKTCHIVLEESNQLWIPEIKTWRLNERHYGALQGLNKKETADKYGDDKVLQWRRSYDTLPPLVDVEDESFSGNDRRYGKIPKDSVPLGENLKVTLERVIPFWEDEIAPAILEDKVILVAAHGNSLRALVKHIEGISDEDIMKFEIPTGEPLVLELDNDLKLIKKYYL